MNGYTTVLDDLKPINCHEPPFLDDTTISISPAISSNQSGWIMKPLLHELHQQPSSTVRSLLYTAPGANRAIGSSRPSWQAPVKSDPTMNIWRSQKNDESVWLVLKRNMLGYAWYIPVIVGDWTRYCQRSTEETWVSWKIHGRHSLSKIKTWYPESSAKMLQDPIADPCGCLTNETS